MCCVRSWAWWLVILSTDKGAHLWRFFFSIEMCHFGFQWHSIYINLCKCSEMIYLCFISFLKNKTAVLNGVCRPVYLQGSGLVPSNLCGVAIHWKVYVYIKQVDWNWHGFIFTNLRFDRCTYPPFQNTILIFCKHTNANK